MRHRQRVRYSAKTRADGFNVKMKGNASEARDPDGNQIARPVRPPTPDGDDRADGQCCDRDGGAVDRRRGVIQCRKLGNERSGLLAAQRQTEQIRELA